MENTFEIITKENDEYNVSVSLANNDEIIYRGTIRGRYDRDLDMVLLNLEYIKTEIPNEAIRRKLVLNLKRFIKKNSSIN